MLIASKFEEIYAPEVNDFVYITDNAYTFQNILDMEVKQNFNQTFSFIILSLYFVQENHDHNRAI